MLWIWVYVFFLGFVWLFFIIKKTNIVEFKNISSDIINISKITFFLLLLFSIIWISLVIHKNIQKQKIEINSNNETQSIYY